jgi:hypothetical protein
MPFLLVTLSAAFESRVRVAVRVADEGAADRT